MHALQVTTTYPPSAASSQSSQCWTLTTGLRAGERDRAPHRRINGLGVLWIKNPSDAA
jgi:hypothetical protein